MDSQTRLLVYLTGELSYKRLRIAALASGNAKLTMTSDDHTRDVTTEELGKLREDVAEIEQILAERGFIED